MSSQFSTALMSISLLAIALAANQAEQNDLADGAQMERGPAAIAMAKKEELLGPLKEAPGLRHTDKIHGPLSVRLEYAGDKPASLGDVFVVRGTVSSREPVQGVDFNWSLPKEVELVSGSQQGRLDSVSAGQPTSVELTLKKVGPGDFQIHLLAGASNKGVRFADSAQLGSPMKNVEMRSVKSAAPASGSIKIFH